MQNSRHLQILKELNLARRSINERVINYGTIPEYTQIKPLSSWIAIFLHKALNDLEYAAFKHRAEMAELDKITQAQIKSSIERAKRPLLECFAEIVGE